MPGTVVLDIQARQTKAGSWLDAVNAVCDALVAKLAEMFSLPLQDIDRSVRLAKYGVDSLVAVELRKLAESYVARAVVHLRDHAECVAGGVGGEGRGEE